MGDWSRGGFGKKGSRELQSSAYVLPLLLWLPGVFLSLHRALRRLGCETDKIFTNSKTEEIEDSVRGASVPLHTGSELVLAGECPWVASDSKQHLFFGQSPYATSALQEAWRTCQGSFPSCFCPQSAWNPQHPAPLAAVLLTCLKGSCA